jgi:molybdopterin-guanine dinucleotide biosynthesis protein A
LEQQHGSAAKSASDRDQILCMPGMLMAGVAGPNCREAEFASAIVERLTPRHAIIGARVSCCADSLLEGPHRLVEQRGQLEDEDTRRLLESGARPVYGLCVKRSHLDEGAQLLAERLGPDSVSVCLSSSLRRVVEPGLFVIVQRQGGQDVTAASDAVWPLADLVVRFDGRVFDPAPEDFGLVDGAWTVRRQATAVVLAGGQSTRMGRDKALLPVSGRPMIEHIVSQLRPHFSQILVSADDASKFSFLGLEVVPDRRPKQGPMMAISSALERSRNDLCFVVSCDVPRLPVPLIMRLLREARSGADVVVPVTHDSLYEPLFALYRRRIQPLLDRALEQQVRRIVRIYEDCDVKTVQLAEGEGPLNVNTPADYERFAREQG